MSKKSKGNAVKKTVVQPDPKFTHEEIMSKANTFGVTAELIAGALRLSGKQELTRKEVETAINNFRKRKV